MDSDYDVAIIGGAFSGAATALMLKRKRPEARVLMAPSGAGCSSRLPPRQKPAPDAGRRGLCPLIGQQYPYRSQVVMQRGDIGF